MIHNLYTDAQDVRKRKLDQLFFDPYFFTAAVSADGLLQRPKEESLDAATAEQSNAPIRNPGRRCATAPPPLASRHGSRQRSVPPSLDRAPDIMLLEEAAAYLRLSPNRVRLLARSGSLPVARVGRAMLFRRAALLAWVRAHE